MAQTSQVLQLLGFCTKKAAKALRMSGLRCFNPRLNFRACTIELLNAGADHKWASFRNNGQNTPRAWSSQCLNRPIYTSMSSDREQLCSELTKFLQYEAVSSGGPSHRWLNRVDKEKPVLLEDDIALLVLDPIFQCSKERRECFLLLQTIKEIQLRFPNVKVIGIEHVSSLSILTELAHVHQFILQEYVTFPILLHTNKSWKFTDSIKEEFYFLVEGLKQVEAYNSVDLVSGSIFQGIDGHLSNSISGNAFGEKQDHFERKIHSRRRIEYAKEPLLGCAWKDTLLSFPSGISVDEEGGRLFISDTNHHRIIITDSSGNIIDFIGSSPGFEDGSFESARLCCPASTLFDSEHNCLFIADSQNHTIRKADLCKRTVEAMLPKSLEGKGIWRTFLSWIHNLGFKSSRSSLVAEQHKILGGEDDVKYPWHLWWKGNEHIGVATRGFSRIKYICRSTGVTESKSEEELPTEPSENEVAKSSISLLLEELPSKYFQLKKVFPTRNLESRYAWMNGILYFADTEHHCILEFEASSRRLSTLNISDLGVLGMPSWWSFPVEFINFERPKDQHGHSKGNYIKDGQNVSEVFNAKPGRSQVVIDVSLTQGEYLAVSIEDCCVWRQARGSVVDLSALDGLLTSDKITGAQQWVDDLEKLVAVDVSSSEITEDAEFNDNPTAVELSKSSLRIYSLIDASLGTGEVVVHAVLYLKCRLNNTSGSTEWVAASSINNDDGSHRRKKKSFSEEDFVNTSRSNLDMLAVNNCCIMSKINIDDKNGEGVLQDQVLMKHLHLVVRFEISDDAPERRAFAVNVQV